MSSLDVNWARQRARAHSKVRKMVDAYIERSGKETIGGKIHEVDPKAVARFKAIVEGNDEVEEAAKENDMPQTAEIEISKTTAWQLYRDLYVGEKHAVDQIARHADLTPQALMAAWDEYEIELDRRSSSAYWARQQLKEASSARVEDCSDGADVDRLEDDSAAPRALAAVQGSGDLAPVLRQLSQLLDMDAVQVSGKVTLDLRVEMELGGGAS